jgi:ribonuclease BN (tRNA processing enzyme)
MQEKIHHIRKWEFNIRKSTIRQENEQFTQVKNSWEKKWAFDPKKHNQARECFKYDIHHIGSIFCTHEHYDHIAGTENLLQFSLSSSIHLFRQLRTLKLIFKWTFLVMKLPKYNCFCIQLNQNSSYLRSNSILP